ncbi:MAG: phosphatidate cytidylyltransferase [Perlucidibaca sp.]
MLKERVLTALVLLPLVFWTVFGGVTLAFPLFAAVIVLIAAWEWTAMMRLAALPARAGFVALVAALLWHQVYLFLLVWGADTGAYFAGRRFGKVKLAPAVSPAKTREGLYGGIATTMAVMLAVACYLGMPLTKGLAFAGVSLVTVLASVLGDLLESMVKRRAGIKDSGNIFPGHGGALDRIDSLTAAAPVFLTGWWLAGGF